MSRGVLLKPYVGLLPTGVHIKLKAGVGVTDGQGGALPGDTNLGVTAFARSRFKVQPIPPSLVWKASIVERRM